MNGIEALWATPAVQAIARALVHFLWQGAAIGLAAATALALVPREKTTVRYAVATAALLLLLACPVVTAFWIAGTPENSIYSATSVVSSPVSPESPESAGILPAASPIAMDRTLGVSLLPWVLGLWLAGVAALSCYHLGGWRQAQSLRHRGTRPLSAEWNTKLREIARRMRIARAVELLESNATPVPAVVGWLRPVVLVPASALAGLSPQQLEAILAHELAHVRRHDYLVNLVQTVVETLLFYHPAVWWVSSQMRRERESCCDDLAVAVCGDRLGYARALADLEGLRLASPRLALAADGGSLLERIRRLVGVPHHRPRRSWMAGLLALSLLPVGTAFQLVPAGPAEAEASPSLASSEASPSPASSSDGQEMGERGTWSLERQKDGRIWLEMKMRSKNGRNNWSNSSTLAASELQGLGAGPEVRFEIRRDAGTFRFQGRMEGSLGTGFFTFEGNPGYVRDMAALDYEVPESRLMELALHDVSLAFVRELHTLGYREASLDELVEFRIHGVTPGFIRELTSLGYRDLPADRLVEFRIHGVKPEFVRELQALGYRDLQPERLVEFRIHGVSPAFVRELADAGYRDIAAEKLVEFRIHGVSPAFVRELADAGYRDLPAERLVEFRIHGVDGKFIAKAASRGYKNLSAEELVELKIVGRLDRGR
jgi:beta-lactamase regulating signal transducer with metallopeptidase domain